jgi:uncharacterized sporulation protein YeaH/YhbH (DUF444 family)
MPIDHDHSRFKKIVQGKIKSNLKQYIQKGEMIGKQGKETISIPIPSIDIPRFRFGHKEQGGVGMGEGEIGQQLSPGSVEPGQGSGAGTGEGDHALEVDVTLDELAIMLGEELELPEIKPKGKEQLVAQKARYTGIAPVGPEGLKHFKRTYKRALQRSIATGVYDPKNPIVIPIREDKRYRSVQPKYLPDTNAVIIYMMDVSGSMGDTEKEIVRIESFWLDTWLRHKYKGLKVRYLIHDVSAREVDRRTFFHTRESGGTMISSAYKTARELIKAEFDPANWNIYLFHFSDGDNLNEDDNKLCTEILQKDLLPIVNQFGYGQVSNSGKFLDYLKANVKEPNMVTSEIGSKDAIYGSIKELLGKGI